MVGGSVCVLCQINMEALRVLSIVVVSGTKKFDGWNVVKEGVEFWKFEVRPDVEVDEVDLFM